LFVVELIVMKMRGIFFPSSACRCKMNIPSEPFEAVREFVLVISVSLLFREWEQYLWLWLSSGFTEGLALPH